MGLINLCTFIPESTLANSTSVKSTDGTKILLHLKGLKDLYSLEKNGSPLDEHVRQYF